MPFVASVVNKATTSLKCRLPVVVCAVMVVGGAASASAQVPSGTPVIINDGQGDQYDPHVSGDWVAYTSANAIRYYNFATAADAQIPLGSSARDLLSDISGSRILFARIIPSVRTAVMLFDAANPQAVPIEIDATPGSIRLGSAIGGHTVAYVDFALAPNGELVIRDLNNTAPSVRATSDTAFDQNPQVSPDGTVVTWEHCVTSQINCDIWQAEKSSSQTQVGVFPTSWTVTVVTQAPYHQGNPDSNGSLVVYDSVVANATFERDIFWRPVDGGTAIQLALPGLQENPSIAGHFIAFEGRTSVFDTADLFIYSIETNRLYRITDTPGINEQLNDITLLPDGRLRAVWATDEDAFDARNVRGATFSLPLDLLQQLIDTVAAFNLSRGIANSVQAKLSNAQSALETGQPAYTARACKVIGAFINEVQALPGHALTAAQAAELVHLATELRSVLGCRT